MTSFRPDGDKAWNYVRESDKISPFLKWVPRGTNLYECCVMDGWPAKVQSNQADGSYATKDLFEPHPSIPRAWKYIARLDDTIVLVNGEKFNPVAMEGSIRSNKNVKEAVVFGAGRPYLGALVVPSEIWADKVSEEILEAVWPIVKQCNESADSFAKISKSMVKLLPWNCEYPRTDKGSVIRQACYKNFKQIIDEAYDSADVSSGDLKEMDIDELKSFIQNLLVETLSLGDVPADDVDFFTLGLDSLQAIQMRSEILKTVQLGNNKLGQNVVFEHPSIEQLSRFLLSLRIGQTLIKQTSVHEEMQELLDKYATFKKTDASSVVSDDKTSTLRSLLTYPRLSREPQARLVPMSLPSSLQALLSLRSTALFELPTTHKHYCASNSPCSIARSTTPYLSALGARSSPCPLISPTRILDFRKMSTTRLPLISRR